MRQAASTQMNQKTGSGCAKETDPLSKAAARAGGRDPGTRAREIVMSNVFFARHTTISIFSRKNEVD